MGTNHQPRDKQRSIVYECALKEQYNNRYSKLNRNNFYASQTEPDEGYIDYATGKRTKPKHRYQSLPMVMQSMKSYEHLHDTLVNQMDNKENQNDDFVSNKPHRNWHNLKKKDVNRATKSLDRKALILAGAIQDDKPKHLPYLYNDYKTQRYNEQYIINPPKISNIAEILRQPAQKQLEPNPKNNEKNQYFTHHLKKAELAVQYENQSLKESIHKQLDANPSL